MTNLNTCSFPGCEKPRYGRIELCHSHYMQRYKGKELTPLKVHRSREQAFKESIRIVDSCWEWTASLDGHGYGTFWNGKKRQAAHRYSWEQANGRSHPRQISTTCATTQLA